MLFCSVTLSRCDSARGRRWISRTDQRETSAQRKDAPPDTSLWNRTACACVCALISPCVKSRFALTCQVFSPLNSTAIVVVICFTLRTNYDYSLQWAGHAEDTLMKSWKPGGRGFVPFHLTSFQGLVAESKIANVECRLSVWVSEVQDSAPDLDFVKFCHFFLRLSGPPMLQFPPWVSQHFKLRPHFGSFKHPNVRVTVRQNQNIRLESHAVVDVVRLWSLYKSLSDLMLHPSTSPVCFFHGKYIRPMLSRICGFLTSKYVRWLLSGQLSLSEHLQYQQNTSSIPLERQQSQLWSCVLPNIIV